MGICFMWESIERKGKEGERLRYGLGELGLVRYGEGNERA